ncbi:hypothetical protein DPEC_G00234210 [Dallia pectoralis]|uniref:Uncharacterized protein n=1 Tax=Dallia pectoralis TaxID=75939 RepID=A0ACC2FXT8_DALPE|nr:hypothetical protein DPEC_G00234210 [Dallia pectoralis]
MNATMEAVAFFFGFVSWVMAAVSIHNRYWKIDSDDGAAIITSTIYENLWMSCATDSLGVHDCREFPSLLALSGCVQACRALMIAAIVIGFFGILATLVGLQCSKIGGENYNLKGKIAGVGGVLFLLQGICTMIAVSWYASNIIHDFFNPFYQGTKFEIGDGLFIGWFSGLFAICGGSCLTCACRFGTNEEKVLYPYQPPTRGTVYSAAPGSHPSALTPSQYGRNAYV